MNCFVTGGAGFIGSALVEALLSRGDGVTVYDNLSSGRREFLAPFEGQNGFRFVEADLLDFEALVQAVEGADVVWHLAANPDIRYGAEKTDLDLQQGTIATYNVLEAARRAGVVKVVFSSSSAVYGLPSILPTPEDYGPLLPHSLYGASKLACEGLVSAFCYSLGFQAWIFRFANVVGPNATHGIIPDLPAKLADDPSRLEVLGNGRQRKSYIHVSDCVAGMLHGFEHADEPVNVFNLGTDDDILISRIAELVVEARGLPDTPIVYTGGDIGWPGDIPVMKLDCKRINSLGWRPRLNSEQAVREAIRALI
ncbi:MAG: NAD-dependent epimerase/dehydratase family protein [Armatimonadetes bacterium]|nr:NAD-dependent epimerase/dehydratase family protein [Armatimonadota bacterium]